MSLCLYLPGTQRMSVRLSMESVIGHTEVSRRNGGLRMELKIIFQKCDQASSHCPCLYIQHDV